MPESARLLHGQFRHANRAFWRTPVAAFFTLVFPLSFLVILVAITGNAVIDEETGLRLAQFSTPVFAVFGVCMASYVSLALGVAYAREAGVLKRLRGTPLPPALYIGGRIASATWISLVTLAVLFSVGVTLYGVQIIWANVPALLLTFLVGIACFAALGLAVVSLAPTPSATQAITNSTLILLSFVSGIFGFADLPEWIDRLASVFPLVHFVDPVATGFNPYAEEPVLSWPDLVVMAAWGIGGGLIAWRYFRWEPRVQRAGQRRRGRGPRGRGSVSPAEPVPVPLHVPPTAVATRPGGREDLPGPRAGAGLSPAVRVHPPGPVRLVTGQGRHAALQMLRDPTALFFSVLFPVLLVVFFSLIYGSQATWSGLPLSQYLAAAFSVYGVATSAYVNLSGAIADQRRLLVLKRLRGTPLPPPAYLAGRVLAAVGIGLASTAGVFVVGVAFLDVDLPPSRWLASLGVFILAAACFAALGLALVSLVDGPQAVIAVALSTLLPLSFVSDIFISTDELPPLLNAVGWAFPLRHATRAAVTATSGGALDATFWGHVGVVCAWAVVGSLVAWRRFRWEPRHGRAA